MLDRDLVVEMLKNSRNINVNSIVPVHYNLTMLAKNLYPNKVCFFGDMLVNNRVIDDSLKSTAISIHNVITVYKQLPDFVIKPVNAYSAGVMTHATNILFDDIHFTSVGASDAYWTTVQGITNLPPGSNTVSWSITKSNVSGNGFPNAKALLFTGYKLSY